MSAETFPGKFGARFSRKAVTPSFTSGDDPRVSANWPSTFNRSNGSAAGPNRQSSWRTRATDTGAVFCAISATIRLAAGSSSSGGWISLILSKRLGDKVCGLVGIAAAPDFTEESMWAGFDAAQRAALLTEGRIALPSDYGEPYIITRRLIEEGRENLVLRSPLDLPFPVRFLQGTCDGDVDMSVALTLLDHVTGPDIRLTLVKGADHRFSDPDCLALIGAAVDEVSARAGRA